MTTLLLRQEELRNTKAHEQELQDAVNRALVDAGTLKAEAAKLRAELEARLKAKRAKRLTPHTVRETAHH